MHVNGRRLALVLVGSLWLLIILTLARVAPRAYPIHRGTAGAFWEAACLLDLSERVYGPLDGWYVYERSNMHGIDLYRVPAAEVEARFGEVLEKLQNGLQDRTLRPDIERGFHDWQARAGGQKDPSELPHFFTNATRQRLMVEDPSLYAFDRELEQDVYQRWERSRWYWATVAFEVVYLCGLVLFAFWPLLRGKGTLAWALHLGALPILFLLPVYLGYATSSFSSAGPGGGVVYPRLVTAFRGSLYGKLEYQVLRYVPPVLEPLSHPRGPPMVLSWRAMPGPLTTLTVGAAVAAAVLGLRWYAGRAAARAQHGDRRNEPRTEQTADHAGPDA
jgi:hypothetical protein